MLNNPVVHQSRRLPRLFHFFLIVCVALILLGVVMIALAADGPATAKESTAEGSLKIESAAEESFIYYAKQELFQNLTATVPHGLRPASLA